MKRLYLIIVAIALSSKAWATWTVVQHKQTAAACAVGTTTCAVTVTSTGAGHVIIIGIGTSATSQTISSVSGGGTYTHPSGCAVSDATLIGSSDCAYTLNSTSGTTSITVTKSGNTGKWLVEAIELSFTGSSVAIDTGNPNGANRAPGSVNNPAGVTMTINGTNDAIFQSIVGGNTVTAVSSPYSTNVDIGTATLSVGDAVAINTASGTAPTWTMSTNRSVMSAIAVSETTAVGGFNKRQKLSKLGY